MNPHRQPTSFAKADNCVHAKRWLAPLLLPVLLATVATIGAPANAQTQTGGVVSTAAPVYLLPDATRTPLATLSPGTQVDVLQVQTDWVQVRFPDRTLGPRTGWIRRNAVTLGKSQPPATKIPPVGKPSPGGTTQRKPPIPPRPAPEPLGVRAFGRFAFTKMAASASFKAITDGDTFPSFGGGAAVTNIWRGLFVEAVVDRMSADGERVFVFEDEVFPLGVPMDVTTLAIDVAAGWRSRPANNMLGFAGGGVTFARYEETSEFADADEDVSERGLGIVGFAGVEGIVSKWVRVAGEVRYRYIPGILGDDGISAHFDESNAGGLGAAITIIIGR